MVVSMFDLRICITDFKTVWYYNILIQPPIRITISMFTGTFDKYGFRLEQNIICGHNATNSGDNIIANSLPNIKLSKVSI